MFQRKAILFCLRKVNKRTIVRLMEYAFFLYLLPLFFISSCKEAGNSIIVTINIENAFSHAHELLLSDFVEHIEYVVLDSKNPIDKYLKVYSCDNYLVCMAYRQIYLFDRVTGKFIREISAYGRGPEEYMNSGYFDSKVQRIISLDFSKNSIEYDLNGKMTRIIPIPRKQTDTPNEEFQIDNFLNSNWVLIKHRFLDNNTLVYCNSNVAGDAKDLLLIADEHGKVLNIFSNHYTFIRELGTITYFPPIFYYHNGNTLFFENCIDTIYQVTRDTLIPHFRLEIGRYRAPYEKRNDLISSLYFHFTQMGESNHFYFFSFVHKKNHEDPSSSSFFGYYDKRNGMVKIADVDKKRRRIINDIDCFSAIQLTSWEINEERNEMISFIEANDVVVWFENNPQKAKELPEHLQQLSTLKPYDNPVVVIATLHP